MKQINQRNDKATDISKWLLISIATISAFFVNYYYNFSGPVKAIVWILWLVAVLALGYFTEQGKKISELAIESKAELEKVVWPSRQETTQITSIVMLMVAVTGFILWFVDSGMLWAIGKITQLG